jgi:hypothetical protein
VPGAHDERILTEQGPRAEEFGSRRAGRDLLVEPGIEPLPHRGHRILEGVELAQAEAGGLVPVPGVVVDEDHEPGSVHLRPRESPA